MDLAKLTKWERNISILLDKIEDCVKTSRASEAKEWATVLNLVAHSEKVRS